MRFATKEQLQDVVEYMGNNIHVPQLVQRFDGENIYSTEERIIGSWVDGRPIYQKTVDLGAAPSAAEKQVAHGISNLNHIIKVNAIAWNGTSASYIIPYVSGRSDTNDWTCMITQINQTNIILKTYYSGWSGLQCYATLQYTKTSDAANSYKIARENDYCMQERIIGTWEDDAGKNTVCRKTYKITIPTTQTATSLDTLVETFTIPVFPLKVEALQFNSGKFAAASNSFFTNDWPSINVYTDGTYKKLTVSIQGLDVNNYKGCIFYVVVDYVKGN